MAEWRTPIFDRTDEDVRSVDRTSAAYQKGALNTDDLNRIEGNFRYLKEHLKADGISIPGSFRNYTETIFNADGTETKTTYTDWQEQNIPWLSEINRIRANHNALVRLFLVGLGLSVQMESNYLDWQDVNDWERIADVGKMMLENIEKEFIYCGMVDSGGERLL